MFRILGTTGDTKWHKRIILTICWRISGGKCGNKENLGRATSLKEEKLSTLCRTGPESVTLNTLHLIPPSASDSKIPVIGVGARVR